MIVQLYYALSQPFHRTGDGAGAAEEDRRRTKGNRGEV